MPIYEYRCISCGFEFEEVQKFSDPSLDKCPSCGKNSAERKVSISSFHLKGGGWYKDGYSNKDSENGNLAKSEKEKNSSKNSGDSDSGSSVSDASKPKTEKKESVPNKKSSSKKEKAA
tara:strand:- start:219 stop:572 length:354 start_codon:yes stop_codon:yes gene_type:complete